MPAGQWTMKGVQDRRHDPRPLSKRLTFIAQ